MIYLVIWTHFVADFIFQTDKMAMNKSTSMKWLSSHVIVYTLPLILFGPLFALINGGTHLMIDFCTSRLTSYLWKKEQRHWFFVAIGFDQALHMTILIATLNLAHPIWTWFR